MNEDTTKSGLGGRREPLTEAEKKRILKLRAKGWTINRISEKVGRSIVSVGRVVNGRSDAQPPTASKGAKLAQKIRKSNHKAGISDQYGSPVPTPANRPLVCLIGTPKDVSASIQELFS